MLSVKDMVEAQASFGDYATEMLELFVTEVIEISSQLTHSTFKVDNLEKRLGSIHSVDFKAQNDNKTLRKEMEQLQQKSQGDERDLQEQLNILKQSLKEKTESEKDLQEELNEVKNKLEESVSNSFS